MITEEQYKEAILMKKKSQETINLYHEEKAESFKKRMEENPIFTDDELKYSAFNLCPYDHGLAYPKGCSIFHYWDCSAILKGIADINVVHTDKLPFMYYSIRGENEKETTRGVIKPKE